MCVFPDSNIQKSHRSRSRDRMSCCKILRNCSTSLYDLRNFSNSSSWKKRKQNERDEAVGKCLKKRRELRGRSWIIFLSSIAENGDVTANAFSASFKTKAREGGTRGWEGTVRGRSMDGEEEVRPGGSCLIPGWRLRVGN